MSFRRAVFCALCVSGSCLLAGCIGLNPRTANQGGGTLLTAGAKVVGGTMATLTADEIQILGEEIAARSPRFAGLEITDEQAEAASDFLVANDIDTLAELQALIDNPGGIQIPESVQALIDAASVLQ